MRALFTEEAIGRSETSDNVRSPINQSPLGADSLSEAAGAGPVQADVTRTNASRPGQV